MRMRNGIVTLEVKGHASKFLESKQVCNNATPFTILMPSAAARPRDTQRDRKQPKWQD